MPERPDSKPLWILKLGGGATINAEGIVRDLAEQDVRAVIVHGANAARDALVERLGTPKQVVTSVSGYDSVLSDVHAIDAILMAYAGLRNKRIVELCQQHGINAVGLSGIDGRLVEGKRNQGIRVREGGKTMIKRDFSGKPQRVNTELLWLLLGNGYTPVLSIPIVDEGGHAINSENDDIVSTLQAALSAERIFQFIEAPGFLENVDDDTSVLARINRDDLERYEAQSQGRMKRKMLALKNLLAAGQSEVIICDGRVSNPLKDGLAGKGTVVK